MDRFALSDGFEDPVQWEKTIHQAFKDAEEDEAFAERNSVGASESTSASPKKDIGASLPISEDIRASSDDTSLSRPDVSVLRPGGCVIACHSRRARR